MPTRIIDVIAGDGQLEAVLAKVTAAEPLEFWVSQTSVGAADSSPVKLVRVLLDSGKLVKLLDELESLCEAEDGARVIVTTADAILPSPEEADEDEAGSGDGDSDSKGDDDRLSRVELYDQLSADARLTGRYFWMVVLSSIVASVGLLRGNSAVIVGAMVIAPLLAPNMALALAATLADLRLAVSALRAGMAGVATAALLGFAAGWWMDVDPSLPEIASRTSIHELDVVLALAAGAAGALAMTSGVSGALVGVMVAVALLPPLMVASLLAGAGHWKPAAGAMLLYSTNIAAVNLAGITVFLCRGISPRGWWERQRAQRAAWIVMAFWVASIAVMIAGLIYYKP